MLDTKEDCTMLRNSVPQEKSNWPASKKWFVFAASFIIGLLFIFVGVYEADRWIKQTVLSKSIMAFYCLITILGIIEMRRQQGDLLKAKTARALALSACVSAMLMLPVWFTDGSHDIQQGVIASGGGWWAFLFFSRGNKPSGKA